VGAVWVTVNLIACAASTRALVVGGGHKHRGWQQMRSLLAQGPPGLLLLNTQ
jgi:hypothetical protein